jgi:hypothetical protein
LTVPIAAVKSSGMTGAGARAAGPRAVAFVLATGAVSWAWSEVGFWAHFRADDQPATWVLTWLMYSLAAAVALRTLRRWPGADLPRLVLVGALYGWVVEGVVASTVYSAPPFTLIWTGVAWHGLLTVVLGWWALPRVVVAGGRGAWVLCGVVGIAWGLWSAGWWAAPPEAGQDAAVPDLAAYALFVVVVCAVAGVGYVVMRACAPRGRDLTTRAGLVVVLGLLGVWGAVVVVVAIPWAPLLLGALVALVVLSLRRLGPAEEPGTPRGSPRPSPLGFEPGIPWRRIAPTALVPVLAVATYAALVPFATSEPGTGPFYVLIVAMIAALSLAGTVALVWSLWRSWRRPRVAVPS